ncbi:Transcriptional regulatory protein ZraR [Desulfosarcina cetonica]|uniref:sigma-54-dependent transcriptional regulator n=1 Tax=Desulfosarcina cetonica TaxID=90730 RepID=UPI0006D144ED|nr:sigma-54 dependent transcriptional regulator [Desulfosarcina cetonica]VTR68697.1 Transcriptional regulatory protein ZraR [Desulfosarcina cetonica]
MNKPVIYLIDDSEAFLDLFASMPEIGEFDLRTFDAPQKALDALECGPAADLIISDIEMPEMSGLELFHKVADLAPSIPVILITAFGSTEQAVQAVQQGAFHYFEKPISDKFPLFWTTVREALAKGEMQHQLAIIKKKRQLGTRAPATLIGHSPAIRRVLEAIQLVAALPATVLITGETGTGKELVAQLIHERSGRLTDAFFTVNCGEFSAGILESELFGHERGAFTGAIDRHVGFFEIADQGTLFLDEIGDAPPTLQTKLLRILETKRFTRVGGTAAIKSDFRLITATNQDLEQCMAEGRFRSDLYYRIKVYEIAIPPLRERKEDIPLLVSYYLAYYNQCYGRSIEGLSEAAQQALRHYDWPGNVRELINVIERAVIVCRESTITTRHLPFETVVDEAVISDLNLAEMEKFTVDLALQRTSGNKSQAAQLLGISRKTLIEKVRKYQLEH